MPRMLQTVGNGEFLTPKSVVFADCRSRLRMLGLR